MQTTTLKSVLAHLRWQAGTEVMKDLSDTDLLERFCAQGEEAAFALLLQRHGPAVLGVCQRVLAKLTVDAPAVVEAVAENVTETVTAATVPAKKTPAKKTPAKKAPAKKASVKKATAKKAPARKAAAKKAPAQQVAATTSTSSS